MKTECNTGMVDIQKAKDFPDRIVIELTPLCNLSCPMCPRHYIQSEKGYIGEELWRRLIDEIADASPKTLILPFWRGESLLHPRFIEFMDYALDRSLPIHMSTNGQLVSSDYAFVLSRLEFVTFSIHTELGYSRAKEFLAIRRDGTPTTQVSFVTGEETGWILNELVLDARLGGFDSVRLYREHTRSGVFGSLGHPLNIRRTFCQKLLDTLVVSYDGKISRCNHIWETEEAINMNLVSIRDAWNSDLLKKIRKEHPDPRCASCDQWMGHTCGESWRSVGGKVEHIVYG